MIYFLSKLKIYNIINFIRNKIYYPEEKMTINENILYLIIQFL